MTHKIPKPLSGGLILSYKCSAECRHCIYGCSQTWSADWISREDIERTLGQLAGKILPNPYGPHTTGLNYGLHFTGGEPFLNFDLLCYAVDTARKLRMPSMFVETNCFWAADDKVTKEKLKLLKSKGLRGIMISVNPFYLEHVPFERTERVIRSSLDIFGRNTMVYQLEYYRRFREMGLSGRISFEEYVQKERREDFFRNVEFLVMGRAPFRLAKLLDRFFTAYPAEQLYRAPCVNAFLTPMHNHFDNYGNYIPGFCGGISLGDCRRLDALLRDGIDTERYQVLSYFIDNEFEGLHRHAADLGFRDDPGGYFSKCHLCMDIRRFLAVNGDFEELRPKEFYQHLD
jgi:hypothetical protein